METHPRFQLRPPVPDDLAAVAQVLAADDLDDAGQVVLDAGFVAGQWRRAGFDLHSDAWVAVDGSGTVVGYGQVVRVEPDEVASWAVVHPERRGLGIGGALLDALIGRAPQLLPDRRAFRFQNAINAGDQAAAALLASRGLRLVRHFWHMGIALLGDVDPGPQPDGVEVGALRAPEELPAVHQVLEEAFAGHWDHHPQTFESWAEQYTEGPDFDPALWLVARESGVAVAAREQERAAATRLGGGAVGALAATRRGGRGWVDLLGVTQERRGRGVASALLRRSFATFAGRGVSEVLLAVDAANATGATALYQSVGMRVVKRWDLWDRVLARSSDS
jgi:mycothiol synthase